MRQAIVEGQFYPEDKEELRKFIDKLYSNLDIASLKPRDLKLAIVPHAGYVFSGKCAAYVYQLLKNKEIDTFIILGTNHSSLGEKIAFSIDDFDNVFGSVSSDMEIIEDLLITGKKAKLDIGVSEEAHKYEHSIEVQLPFLKTVNSKFMIVPILLRDLSIMEIEKFGKMLSNLVKEQEKKQKKVFILASSDFTHYGKGYGFMPFTDKIKENLYALDNKAIDKIVSLDIDGFYGSARQMTICGFNAITVLMSVAKNLNLKADKLCYYTSGDIMNKWDNVVGYAAIGFS
jgi:MEMO1 family protein